MNPENIKEIVETIKTLNINFNDATTQKIAEAIKPVVTLFFVKELISGFFILLGLVLFLLITYKLIYKATQDWKEIELKRIEKRKY
jgi:flagellar biosynthesis/type III secretory pathway M-ring protein FliF/YscJ